jgi:hypothetical protein
MAMTSKLKAFFVAGQRPDFVMSTEIDGYDFQTSTANNPAAVANETEYIQVGGLNSNTAGYRLGSTNTLSVDKFVYSTETFNSAITTVSVAKAFSAMFSATSVNKGYSYAGAVPAAKGSTSGTTNIQGINFATDATFTTAAVAVSSGAGTTCIAYNGGGVGYTTTYSLAGTAIQGFTYSTETAANTGYVLNANGGMPNSYSRYSNYSTTKGYTGGGMVVGDRTNIISYMQFSDGTNGNLSATLSSPKIGHGATQSAYV